MSRTKGAINKKIMLPEVYELDAIDRLQMIAALLVEIISEELCEKD